MEELDPNMHSEPGHPLIENAKWWLDDLKNMGIRDVFAGGSIIAGGIDVIRNRDDPLKIARGAGKIAFGLIIGNTGR